MYSKTTLIGNVGNPPEIRETTSGKKVGRVSIATSKSYKDKAGEWQKTTEWHTIIGWEYSAEAIGRLGSGDQVLIEGENKTRKYEDKNGVEKKVTEIIASKVLVMNKRDNEPSSSAPPPSPGASPVTSPLVGGDDDLPF